MSGVFLLKYYFGDNMKTEIGPKESNRSEAFRLWMTAPVPMVTLVKTMNVSRLLKVSRKSGMKFNTLMCWCIVRAAGGMKEFYTLPERGKLFHYDTLAVNVVVRNNKGGINSCDIPFSDDLRQFNSDYLKLTVKTADECRSSYLEGCMIIGTSAMTRSALTKTN